MKKLILVFAAIAISAGAYTQTDSTNRKMSPQDMHKNQNQHMQNNPVDKTQQDGFIMKNGKLMQVKNGELTVLENDLTLSNGIKIMTDGNYTKNDGTTTMLKDGQHLDLEGNMTFVKTDKDRDMYLVPDSTRKKDF